MRERAQTYLKRALAGTDDPFGLIRLDGDELAGNPVRLIEEASTVALFGGRRVVSLRAGGKNIVPALEPVLASPPPDAIIVIEAGDLQRGAPLRALGESSPRVAAIACYADTDRDVGRLIDTMVAEAGLSIERDARTDLMALLGGDRLASRGEIAKLILYATGDTRITGAHVRAIVGDALESRARRYLRRRVGGERTRGGKRLRQGDGRRHPPRCRAWRRQPRRPRAASAATDCRGRRQASSAPSRARVPPSIFAAGPLVETALRNWTAARLAVAFVTLDEALLAARRNAGLAPAIAERALLSLASAARRRGEGLEATLC